MKKSKNLAKILTVLSLVSVISVHSAQQPQAGKGRHMRKNSFLTSFKKGKKNRKIEQYMHGDLSWFDKDKLDILDKTDPGCLEKRLFELYQKAKAKGISNSVFNEDEEKQQEIVKQKDIRIPTYFFIGATGSGKSLTIAALQGHVIEEKDIDEVEYYVSSNEEDQGGFLYKENPLVEFPGIGNGSNGETAGAKIYYSADKAENKAFCDTEGFMGVRDTEYTDMCASAISTFFSLKTNKIGGIAFVVSASDVDAARARSLKSSALFLRQYFSSVITKELRRSILLLVTKTTKGIKKERKNVIEKLCSTIQSSYLHFYNKKYKNKKPENEKDNLADQKSFFDLFLEEKAQLHLEKSFLDNPEELNKIDNFKLDREKIKFFYPTCQKSIKNTLLSLSNLKPLSHTNLASFDNPLSQYLKRKVIKIASEIDKRVVDLNLSKERSYIYQLLTIQKDTKDSSSLNLFINKLEKEVIDKKKENEELLTSEILECVFKEKHLQQASYRHRKGYFNSISKDINDDLDEMFDGKVFSNDPGFISKTASRAVGVGCTVISPVAYLASCILNAPGHIYDGFLKKNFVYDGGELIYRIIVKHKAGGGFVFENPTEEIVKQKDYACQEASNDSSDTITCTSNKEILIKRDLWKFSHYSKYGEGADCTVKLFSKKKDLSASHVKHLKNKERIKQIEEKDKGFGLKTFIKNMKDESVNDLKQKKYVIDKMIQENKESLISEKLQRIKMINCWKNFIFREKSTDASLLNCYIRDFEKATDLVIQDDLLLNNQKSKPILSAQIEGINNNTTISHTSVQNHNQLL